MKRFLAGSIVLAVFGIFLAVSFAGEKPEVIAYYFHTTFRCPSCRKIEQYTGEALKENFAKEMESGELVYKVVNTDDAGNEHFMRDYQLYTKSVVLSLVKDGKEVKFKNLEKVWRLLGNKDEFCRYIKEETADFLGALRKDDKP
jgi:hypothetical protein